MSSRTRVTLLVGAIVMMLPVSVAMAEGTGDPNRPVIVTFTKWVFPNSPNMAGVTGGAVPGVFVGETLQTQMSVNPDLEGKVNRLEVVYEVQDQDGDRGFTALIRGGSNRVELFGLFDGVILAGWRTGARVEVAWQRYPASDPICLDAGAPPTLNCFKGTIYVGRAPRD